MIKKQIATTTPRNRTLAAALLTAMLASNAAHATPISWTGATTGLWSATGSWSTSAVPTSSDDLTILGPGNAAGALTINFDTDGSANSINFTDTSAVSLTNTTSGANKTLTLGTGGLTTGTGAVAIGSVTALQNINIALGGNQTWNVGSGGLTVTNVISGSGFSLAKSGAGTLTLSGANTYSGGTTVSAGKLSLGNATAAGTNTITLAGGTLGNSVNGIINANAINVTANSTLQIGSGQNWTLSGNITGSGNINYTPVGSAATLALGGDNSGYTGTFTQSTANAALQFNSATSGSAAAAWTLNSATAGRTKFGNFSGTINFGSLSGSALGVVNNTAGTVTISAGALNTSTTFSGTLVTGTGVIALNKVGTGTLTLSGANTYTGGTTISAGKLNVTSGTGTGAVAVSGGTSATLGGTGTITGAVTVTNGSRLAPGTVTTSSNFGSAGTLTLSNAGGLTLTDAHLDFDLSTTAGGTNDTIALGSNALSFSTLNFSFSGTTLDTTTAYTLIGTTGSVIGTLGNITTDFSAVTGASYTATYSSTGTGLQVSFTAVPEPNQVALAIVGLLGVTVFIRRRKQMS